MDSDDEKRPGHNAEPPVRALRLPGFINDDEVGLGDAIKRATSYMGIKPCGAADAGRPRSTSGLSSQAAGSSGHL